MFTETQNSINLSDGKSYIIFGDFHPYPTFNGITVFSTYNLAISRLTDLVGNISNALSTSGLTLIKEATTPTRLYVYELGQW